MYNYDLTLFISFHFRSFSRTNFGCPPHLKKRKLEGTDTLGTSMLSVQSNMFSKSIDTTDTKDDESPAKRRKKSTTTSDDLRRDSESPKQILLPQKKRVLPTSTAASPVKKSARASQQSTPPEEQVDDETLIRETEAALKSLSGSWPGPRGSSYRRGSEHDESPTFENLFEEKKANAKLSPSMCTSSSSSSDNACSLKDVITLRDQHAEDKSSTSSSGSSSKHSDSRPGSASKSNTKGPGKPISRSEMTELENLLKIENDCATIQSQTGGVRGKQLKDKVGKIAMVSEGHTSQYEPPDFNELVDDSSNELEIDMSDPCMDKDGDDDKLGESSKSRKKDNDDVKRGRYAEMSVSHTQGYVQSPYSSGCSTSAPSFSSASSAFRPPNIDSKTQAQRAGGLGTHTMPPLGPFPAEATFVGYPSAVALQDAVPPPGHAVQSLSSLEEDKLARGPTTSGLMQLKPPGKEVDTRNEPPSIVKPTAVSVASPDAKQYTILQPAPAGSRAASALQDIAREGVQVVSAVSSNSSSLPAVTQASSGETSPANANQPSTPGFERPTGTLSPASMSRGKRSIFYFLMQVKILDSRAFDQYPQIRTLAF